MARITAFDRHTSHNLPIGELSGGISERAPRTRLHSSALALTAILVGLLVLYIATLIGSITAVVVLGFQIVTGDPTPLQGLGMAVGLSTTALLGAVLLKGLVHETDYDCSEFVELTADEEPAFFAFLNEICRRADAPVPDRVFASPHVNAGVYVESSVLNIFRSAEKHLFVGLGMVEALNRTELEAVLAHEFGHFSQQALWLHDWVRILTGIVEELGRGRTALETTVERWSLSPVPSPGVAALFDLGSRIVRRLWYPVSTTIDRLEDSVSRQMEFDADDVAVDLTGSDAIVHALVRIDWAERCHTQTMYDLEQALDDGLRTDDLFFHQSQLSETMRRRLGDPTLGRPPELPDDRSTYNRAFTEAGDLSYSVDEPGTHPSHRLREHLAYQRYERTDFDRRSAWTLFADPEDLRTRVTDLVYRQRWHSDVEARPASEVQRHLDAEHGEMLLDDGDQVVYGHRFIEPGDLGEATEEAIHDNWSDDRLRQAIQRLTGPEYQEAICRMSRHLDDTSEPAAIGTDGRPGPCDEISLTGDATSPEDDRQWLADRDRRLLVAALRAATRQGETEYDELIDRYAFHLHLQDMIRWMRHHGVLVEHLATAGADAEAAAAGEGPTAAEARSLLGSLYDGLADGLSNFPPTPNLHGLSQDEPLTMLILDSPLPDRDDLTSGDVETEITRRFADCWSRVASRLQHFRWKSLGALLLYQRRLFSPLT